jgi:hypothetical protein
MAFELQGRSLRATIAARYYFGQPVAGASVKYVVHHLPYYSPLRFDPEGDGEGFDGDYFYGGEQRSEGTARLNDDGTAEIMVPLPPSADGRDYRARVEARVTDVSGREVAGSASAVATVGRFLLTAQGERYVYGPGSTAAMNVRALSYDGMAQAGVPVHVVLERWEDGRGRDREGGMQGIPSGAIGDREGEKYERRWVAVSSRAENRHTHKRYCVTAPVTQTNDPEGDRGASHERDAEGGGGECERQERERDADRQDHRRQVHARRARHGPGRVRIGRHPRANVMTGRPQRPPKIGSAEMMDDDIHLQGRKEDERVERDDLRQSPQQPQGKPLPHHLMAICLGRRGRRHPRSAGPDPPPG